MGELSLTTWTYTRLSGSVLAFLTCRPWRVTSGRAAWAIGNAWGERTFAAPAGKWRDALTGREHVIADQGIRASALFAELPVALLVRV